LRHRDETFRGSAAAEIVHAKDLDIIGRQRQADRLTLSLAGLVEEEHVQIRIVLPGTRDLEERQAPRRDRAVADVWEDGAGRDQAQRIRPLSHGR